MAWPRSKCLPSRLMCATNSSVTCDSATSVTSSRCLAISESSRSKGPEKFSSSTTNGSVRPPRAVGTAAPAGAAGAAAFIGLAGPVDPVGAVGPLGTGSSAAGPSTPTPVAVSVPDELIRPRYAL
ncbi:exported hypothetical protein [Frankia sp. Hr75.2]|nr:exported hypothetical protein [Frankia sp. Hr75.2]